MNRKMNLQTALSSVSEEMIFKMSSEVGISIAIEKCSSARLAKCIFFDSSKIQNWKDLICTFSEKLEFQQTSNRGYDFGLDAFVDCMRDAIDECENGLILYFRRSNKILSDDKKISFDSWLSAIGAVADYASQSIEAGEWWDRGPRYFKVILEKAPKHALATEISG